MSIGTRYGSQAPAPAARTSAAPPRSKYAGVKAADSRNPMLTEGEYRVCIESCDVGYNPAKRRESTKIGMRVVRVYTGSANVGSSYTMICSDTDAGTRELKRMAIAAAGFGATRDERAAGKGVPVKDAEAAYERFEATEIPDGYDGCMLDRMVGGAGLDHVPPLIGRHVDVIVSRGNPVMADGVDTGDYYRRYDWAVVQDEEQPQ